MRNFFATIRTVMWDIFRGDQVLQELRLMSSQPRASHILTVLQGRQLVDSLVCFIQTRNHFRTWVTDLAEETAGEAHLKPMTRLIAVDQMATRFD